MNFAPNIVKRLRHLLLLAAATLSLPAQQSGIEQSSELLVVPAGDKFLRWHGHSGRSYFLQVSDVNEPLAKWNWVPVIEAGNDEQISYEVGGTAAKGFYRLKYTDQVPEWWQTLESADFDADGVSNIDEVGPLAPLIATDPLDNDTDHDGMKDGYERENQLDPNASDAAADPDGDGLSNADELQHGTQPQNPDTDDDGILDGAEIQNGTDPVEDLKPLNPGTYSVSSVSCTVAALGLPSTGDLADKVFYEKIVYTRKVDASGSETKDNGDVESFNLDSDYTQTCNWTRSELILTGGDPFWTWSRDDHQDGSSAHDINIHDSAGVLKSNELTTYSYSRDLTPFASTLVDGTKVLAKPNENPVTTNVTADFPMAETGLSIPSDSEYQTAPPETPSQRKWTKSTNGGEVEETWEISNVIPWKTLAEESRVAAKDNPTSSNTFAGLLFDNPDIREQGDTILLHVQGGRYLDGSGVYQRGVVQIMAADQAVVVRKHSKYVKGDDLLAAAHEITEFQTIQAGQNQTITVEAVPIAGYDQVSTTLEYSVVEVRSRDRGIIGSMALMPGGPSLNFHVGNKDYGTYSVPVTGLEGNLAHFYPTESKIFDTTETDNHDAWKNSQGSMPAEELSALQGVADNPALPGANPTGHGGISGNAGDFDARAISQDVVFWWEGNRLWFSTVSDDLGTLEITLKVDGQEAPPVTHSLVADADFERVIAAAEGFIAGDDPPEIKAWEDYPEPVSEYPQPPVIAAAEEPAFMAATPPAVAEEFGAIQLENPTATLADPPTFYWLVARTDDEPVFADDGNAATEEWTEAERDGFFLILSNLGYAYQSGGNGGIAAAPGGVPVPAGWRGVPPVKTEIELPAELRNRGLLAKALKWVIERAVKGQLAYSEGAIFGLWDGVKGDVEGVADTVRLAAGGWDDAAIFIGRYLKDPYRAAAELSDTFEAVKELGWHGIKSNVKAMVDTMLSDFTSNQEDRLKLVLGDECEDPIYLTAYLAGYTGGYIGEQVAVAFFTAGIAKAGVVAKVLKTGTGAISTLMSKAAAKFPTQIALAGGEAISEGVHIQKMSKGFFGEFARTARSANDARSARRSASLCRTTTGCLAAGTLVAMADGSWRPVENVHTRDRVLARDDHGRSVAQTVLSQVRNTSRVMQRISWDENGDRDADGIVSATPEHPFLVIDKGWTRADALRAGMVLTTNNGGSAIILASESISGETTTYNLDVDGPDTFIVASAEEKGVLVHNNEQDMYPYGKAATEGIEQGLSFRVKKDISGNWVEDIAGGLYKNPQHHFFWDAWLRDNFAPEYRSRIDPFPGIELSHMDHVNLEDAARQWFKDNLGFQTAGGTARYPAKGEWRNISIKDIRAAAKSSAMQIGIPEKKIHQMSNASLGYLRKHFFKYGCNAN